MNIPRPPQFSGDNVLRWIIDVQDYFDYLQSPDSMRLYIVGLLFEHPTSKWCKYYQSSDPNCTWQVFLDAVIQEFHPTAVLLNNIQQSLYKWRDESTQKSVSKSTQLLKPSAELSTKSDLERPIELSTESDLPLSTESDSTEPTHDLFHIDDMALVVPSNTLIEGETIATDIDCDIVDLVDFEGFHYDYLDNISIGKQVYALKKASKFVVSCTQNDPSLKTFCGDGDGRWTNFSLVQNELLYSILGQLNLQRALIPASYLILEQ